MARSIVGIDLGGSYVKLVMREGGSRRVVARRLPEDIIDSGTIVAPETMAQFLRDTRAEEHIRPKDCTVVLGPEQCFFRHVTLPAMTVAELKLNLPYEFRDYIDDDPSSYVYDYAVDELVRDDVGTPQRLELYAAAVQQATVDRLNTMLKKGGFRLRGVFPSQMVLARLLADYEAAHPDDAGHDAVFVDLGSDSVNVSLYHGTDFQALRSIEFGCREFDKAVAELRNIDRYTAASYVSGNFENVLDTPECAAVCDRISVEVNKVVNFYNFSNRDKDIDRMYLMGGGAQIPQLVAALAEAVGVPVMRATVLAGVPGDAADGAGSDAAGRGGATIPRGGRVVGLRDQGLLAYGCMREGEAM